MPSLTRQVCISGFECQFEHLLLYNVYLFLLRAQLQTEKKSKFHMKHCKIYVYIISSFFMSRVPFSHGLCCSYQIKFLPRVPSMLMILCLYFFGLGRFQLDTLDGNPDV